MRYLLGTNVVSDLIRNPQGRVAARIAAVGEDRIYTSIVVAAELRYGSIKKGSPRLSAQIDVVLGALQVVPLEPPVDAVYGRIRATLERAGQTIGGNDLLIAAHALALGDILVTANEREFSRVDGMILENWLNESEPG